MTSGTQFFNGLPAPNNIVGRYVATTANGYGGVFYWAGGGVHGILLLMLLCQLQV